MFERISKSLNLLIETQGLLHPRDLAERLGLTVLEIPYRRLSSISLNFEDVPFVAVDSTLPVYQQNGALLHEVAHQVLHPGTTRFFIEVHLFERQGKYEMEAHLFALLYTLRWDEEGFESLKRKTPQAASRLALRGFVLSASCLHFCLHTSRNPGKSRGFLRNYNPALPKI